MPVTHKGCIFTYAVANKLLLQWASWTAADLQQVRGESCIQMYDTAKDVWTAKVVPCLPHPLVCCPVYVRTRNHLRQHNATCDLRKDNSKWKHTRG